jgi:stage II sporulation protein D
MCRLVGLLIFISVAIVGCAPLPPLVTDESLTETSDNVQDTSVTDTFIAISPQPSSNFVATDSLNINTKSSFNNAIPIPVEFNRPLQVGLLMGVSQVNFAGSDSVMLSFNGEPFEKHAAEGTLSLRQGKILWRGKNESGISADSVTMAPVGNALLPLEKKNYRGQFRISVQKGKLLVVNSVSIEDYLKGVVPYEIGTLDSSAIDALKAQAVAARTYAYRHFGSRISQGFDVYADVKDQVYNGASGEVSLTNIAVEATAGEVLTFNGTFIEAYYHSTCGGYTENLETWGRSGLPYLQSQPDLKPDGQPWCSASSYNHWTYRFTDKELIPLLKKNGTDAKADKIPNFTKINKIKIQDRLPGGRVKTLLIETNKGTMTVKGDRTRWLFKRGAKILPSSKFSVSREGNSWIIKGSGFGHGVGMCQMGVRERARAGQSYQEILSHYYPGTTLERLVPP